MTPIEANDESNSEGSRVDDGANLADHPAGPGPPATHEDGRPRLRGHRGVYLAQAAIAGVALFVVFAAEDALVNGAVLAAIASTAFVLMVTPHSVVATPRHAIGGHAVCALAGSLVAILLASGPGETLPDDVLLFPEFAAALAVGASIVLMGLTDTEHPPAAGTALGFAVVDFDTVLLLVLAASIAALVVAQQLLLPRLRDLL